MSTIGIRLPESLHAGIREAARREGTSINFEAVARACRAGGPARATARRVHGDSQPQARRIPARLAPAVVDGASGPTTGARASST